jgi:hypothetical protein
VIRAKLFSLRRRPSSFLFAFPATAHGSRQIIYKRSAARVGVPTQLWIRPELEFLTGQGTNSSDQTLSTDGLLEPFYKEILIGINKVLKKRNTEKKRTLFF